MLDLALLMLMTLTTAIYMYVVAATTCIHTHVLATGSVESDGGKSQYGVFLIALVCFHGNQVPISLGNDSAMYVHVVVLGSSYVHVHVCLCIWPQSQWVWTTVYLVTSLFLRA
jgi:hypothetical protein